MSTDPRDRSDAPSRHWHPPSRRDHARSESCAPPGRDVPSPHRSVSPGGMGMSSTAVSRHRLVDGEPRAVVPPPPAAPVADAESARVAGRYRYDRRTGDWWWSPEMFALHGLPPGAPQPDTETYLAYQHAGDRARLLAAMSAACSSGRDFALETRIIRADDQERDVVLVGECRTDDAGTVTAVEGMAIDITQCHPPGSPTDRAQALQAE